MDCPDTAGDLLAFWGRDTPEEEERDAIEPDDLLPDEEDVGAPPASHEAIKRAAKRWNDFVAVTNGRGQEEVSEAGFVFAAALGLEGPKLEHAVECLKLWTNDESPSQGTMGLLFGLLIADEANLERELEGPEIG